MRTLRLRKVVAQDHVTRIQKSKEVCRMMRPDLPSPTQNVAQILQDSVRVLCFFLFCFFFKKQNSFPGSIPDTESDLKGCSPETCIPQGACAGKCETRKATPSLARGGDRALPLPFCHSLS